MTSRNIRVRRFKALLAVSSVVALMTFAESALAATATWCVPNATIRSKCPRVSPTLQGAIDEAAPNDIIYVGPGTPAERITITKRLTIKGLPGHVLTDAGLPPGGALLSITGALPRGPRLEFVVLDVVTSDTGIFVAPSVIFAEFRQVRVESRQIPKPAVGVQASGTSRTLFLGSKSATDDEQARVAGFQVGLDLNDVGYVDVEPAIIEDNDVGLRLSRGGYQLFWNTFRNNGIALEVCGLNVCDINSNTFIENGLAVHWALCHNPDTGISAQKMVEFQHNTFIDNVENVLIETSPGEWSNNYLDDPGCFVQWMNMVHDGDKQPSFKARACRKI